MTPKEIFQKIYNENNCELYTNSFKVNGEVGANIHITKYNLKVFYHENIIDAFYDFGNSDTALITINLPLPIPFPDFQLITIDHITKLFFFRKRNWHLKCKNRSLKNKIETLLRKHTFVNLMENTAFEPTITGIKSEFSYKISTRFSLDYSDNVTSISSILDFHKELIDLIKEK